MNTSRRFLLRIPDLIVQEMIAQATAELPNECCGLLAGTIGEDGAVAEVAVCYPLINELKSPTEFVSEPRSHLLAERDVRRRGLEVLAVYHSHPTSAPIPSRRDLERNYSEAIINIIIGWNDQQIDMRAWWLTSEAFTPAQMQIVPVFIPHSEFRIQN